MKSQSFPETIPAAYAGNEILSHAYRKGWNHGHGIACHNVPTLGEHVRSDSLGRVTVDAENIREIHEDACRASADNARQYSPFEFTAKAFNDLDEGGWFVFDPDENLMNKVQPFDTEADARAYITEVAESAEDAEEFTVKEMPSADEAWEAFQEGEGDAINADLATYTNEDYGIASEDESEGEEPNGGDEAGNICEDEDTSKEPFPHVSDRETQD